MHQRPLLGCLALCLGLLAACSDTAQEDVRAWMVQQKTQAQSKIAQLSPPKPFQPERYAVEEAGDPFDAAKLAQALRTNGGQQGAASGQIQAELQRHKEPLEAIPLDAVAMVGTLRRNGVPTALVKVDQLLYPVQVGNRLGLNYGKIIRITETSIQLREIIQDVTGEWIERDTELVLQETQK